MKRLNILSNVNLKLLTLVIGLYFLTGFTAQAQNRTIQSQNQNQIDAQTQTDGLNGRQTLIQQLNLTRDQIQQIRAINRETSESRRNANQRQAQARQNLDSAIYAAEPNQADVNEKLRELTEAQVALTTVRVQNEFRIRQILSPEQLTKFIELRQRVAGKFGQTNRIFQNKRLRQSE